MDLETKFRENYVSQQPIPYGIPSSQGIFLQDFHQIDHQFHHGNNGSSSSNPNLRTQNFDQPCDNFHYQQCSGFDNAYYQELKPFVVDQNNGGTSGHAHVMDNFLYGGFGFNNPPQRNYQQLDMMVANQSYNFPFNPQEIAKPVNFVVPDEVSCISPVNYSKRIGMNKNNRAFPNSRRSYKVRKKSNIVKGQWTAEEDGLLIQLVEQYGLRKWSHIAQILPGRIGKQCRERWHNHLRPDIKKDTWSDEEDKILIQAHSEIGNKWAEIAKRLPGRTENSIKNHWNATKRRQYSKRKCRSKYPRGTLLQEYIKSLNLDKNPPIDYRRRSSVNAMKMKTAGTIKLAAAPPPQPQPEDNQFLAPNCDDFNEDVPDFCFDENLFEEGCSIDSLLMDEKEFDEGKMHSVEGKDSDDQGGTSIVNLIDTEMSMEIMESMLGVEVKKEMDLVEMMSQVNATIK